MDARAGFSLLKELREHGLISCTKRWREISDKPVLCLILHPMLANQPEVRANLKEWLKEPGQTLDCWGEEDAHSACRGLRYISLRCEIKSVCTEILKIRF